MKLILVLGMGRFGKHLARKMTELNNDVKIKLIKKNQLLKNWPLILQMRTLATAQAKQSCQTLGVRNFDICFVAIA